MKNQIVRKIFTMFCLCAFLGVPLVANATLIGTGDLAISWDGILTNVPWYVNYYGTTSNMSSTMSNYSLNKTPIFCVSGEDASASATLYDFNAIDSSLNKPNIAEAAWIADNYMSYGLSHAYAQLAIWVVMQVQGGGHSYSDFYNTYKNALNPILTEAANHLNYTTLDFYYAISPSTQNPNSPNYQDFLTPAPTPEPATLLLMGLGSGVLGTGITRLRRKFKKA